MGIFIIIIIIAVWLIGKAILNSKVNNYPTDRVDTNKMTVDKIRNNLSYEQVKRNMVNGKYDKK